MTLHYTPEQVTLMTKTVQPVATDAEAQQLVQDWLALHADNEQLRTVIGCFAEACDRDARKYRQPVAGVNGPSPSPYDCYGYNILTRLAEELREVALRPEGPR